MGTVVSRRSRERPSRRLDEVPPLPPGRRRGQCPRVAAAGSGACTGADERSRDANAPVAAERRAALHGGIAAGRDRATARDALRTAAHTSRCRHRAPPDLGPRESGHGNDASRAQDVVQRVHRAAAVDGLQQRFDRRREGASPPLRREAERRRARAVCGRAAVLPNGSRRAPGPPAVGRDPGLDASRRRHLARQPAVVSRSATSHQPRRSRRTTPCDRARNASRQRRARGDARERTGISRRHGAALHDRRRFSGSPTSHTSSATSPG